MSRMKVARTYCDEAGETHFGEAEIDFESIQIAPLANTVEASKLTPATGYRFIRNTACELDEWDGWHPAPCRQLVVLLRGELETEVSDGELMRWGPGDLVLVEDVKGKGHRNRALKKGEALMLFVPILE